VSGNSGIDQTSTFTYNGQGLLASVTDGLNHTTRFGHDAQGNLIRTTDALGNTTQAKYDAANRLIEAINPKGRSAYFAYDALDRLLSSTDALGGATQVSYDANDNPLTVVDANSHAIETNVYDLRNRLTSRTDAVGKQSTYRYDPNDNLVQTTDRKGQVTNLQYDALNRISQIVDADGRITQYSYDLAGNLAHIADSRSGDILLSYDSLNRLTQVITGQGTVNYQYDAANRLTALSYVKPDTTVLSALAYTYDANGNRISQSLNAKTDTPFTATYDAANRMATYNGYPLTYDANGNLIQRQTATGTVTYTWDARNRLTGISGPSGTASFKYDALGRRIEKTVNGVSTQYLYDGNQAIAELSGSAIGATYLTGLQIDEVLARYSASGDRSLIADALGSVLAQADGTGAVQTQYSYSPYGETQTTGVNDGNPVQYTGRENDQTGLYYYRARYYDPQLKRFVSADPIGIAGGINLYQYTNSNPVSFTDPLGLKAFCLPGMKCWSDIPDPTESIPPKSPKQPESPIGPNAKPKGEECTHFLPSVSGCTACCAKMNRMNPNIITPCVINYCTDPAGITLIKPPEMCSVASATGGGLPW
jgi:RHS repeat-associated protein